MPAKRDPSPVAAGPRPDLATRVMVVLAWLVTAATLIVPLAVTPDLLDRFRVIKESITRSEGILGLFLIVLAAAFGGVERLREMLRERAIVAITVAGVVWAGVTSLTSTHRLLSVESFVTMLTSTIVFLIVWYAAPRISLTILDVLVPAALINTLLAALQEYGLYQPFTVDPDTYRHLTATALIGNPNIVGSYLALVAVILAAAAARIGGARRWLYALGAFFTAAGVFVSQTRTAVIALMAGLVLLAIGRSVKRAALVGLGLAVLFGAGAALNMRVIKRLTALPRSISTRGLEAVTSGRVTPAVAALEMFRDHPATGVGPGTYGFQYMAYHVRVREKHVLAGEGVRPTSFGEAHNDHLQLLAETGLPGYLLFLTAVAVVARAGRRADDTPRARIARGLAVPLTGTFLVLCLAQFPLHVAVTRHLVMTMAGLIVGWSRR